MNLKLVILLAIFGLISADKNKNKNKNKNSDESDKSNDRKSCSGQKLYENRVIRSNGTFVNFTNACSLSECEAHCRAQAGGCAAFSWSCSQKICISTSCGNLVLECDKDYDTVIKYNAVIYGTHLPAPLYEFPMTSYCGMASTGLYDGRMGSVAIGFKPYVGPLYGNSLNCKIFKDGSSGLANTNFLNGPASLTSNNQCRTYAMSFVLFNCTNLSATLAHFRPLNVAIQINSTGSMTIAHPCLQTIFVDYKFTCNKPYHLALTYQASSSELNVYVNGALVFETYLTCTSNSMPLEAATLFGNFGSANNTAFFGTIYGLAIFNEGLNVQNIYSHMLGYTQGLIRLQPCPEKHCCTGGTSS